jgi:uncharacterized membrane protein
VTFTHPWWLLLLIPALGGLALSYRTVSGMMRSRKRFAFALRALLVACLVIALAGPESRRPNEGTCTIFLLDRSDSVAGLDRERQVQFVSEAVRRLGPEDQAAVVAFGKEAAVDVAPGKLPGVDRILSVVDGSASDLAAAIRLASASFPDGKARRIVLLSDGNETQGDAAEAASVAATDGIPIDHVVLGTEPRDGEAVLVQADMPNEIRQGQPFAIRVTVDSMTNGPAELLVDRNGVTIQRVPITLSEGRNTYVINQRLDDTGFHRFRVTLSADRDRDNRNNVGMGFVAVRGRPRVLIVQGDPSRDQLAQALRQQGLDVEVCGPNGVPVRPEEFQPFDAVFFNDLNAAKVTPGQMKLAQSAVRDAGVGFAMIGGEDSFLPGGWYGTPVAEALPVDLDIRQRKSFPSTTILIIADTSGSMGAIEDGQPKVRLAAKAAEQTVQMLSPLDKLGVVASTDGIEFVAPIQKLDNKAAVVSQIRRLGVGGGGIYMRPSMEFAKRHLEPDDSKVRHLIVLADGSDCDLQEGTIPMAAELFAQKITTTTVAIGDGPHVPYLRALAAAGGGRFYLAQRASQLPAIFTQDAAVMSRSAIEEGAFFPKVALGEEILRGIDTDAIPALLAYCLTDARPLARVGMRTKKDDPLLAVWQYGLGSSLAFTSDAQARWAAKWVEWGGFGQFWAQATRSIARRATSNTYQIASTQSGTGGTVTILAQDSQGNPVNEAPEQVRLAIPGGSFRDLVLTQTGPGTFEAKFPTGELGSYIVSVSEKDPLGGTRVSSSGFSIPYPAEYRSFRPNAALLERISQETGGQALLNPAEAIRPVSEPGFSIRELWSLFVMLAALLLPLDVAARRIALPIGEILAKAWAWMRRQREVPAAPTHVDQLRRAKQRATQSNEVVTPAVTPAAAREPEKPATPAAPSAPGATSSQLLDAKRRRRGEGGDG